MERKTPLYDIHCKLGGKMVPFGGYLMPVQYGAGVIAEHMATRTQAGLFDVSHMGEFEVSGPGSLAFLQQVLTNNMDGMQDGDCRYSPMCNWQGGAVDDLIVYKLGQERYWMVVNASNREKDWNWLSQFLGDAVAMQDLSEQTAEVALQGPRAETILSGLCDARQLPKQSYHFVEDIVVCGVHCLVSRTGYTGEDGFELYCRSEDAAALWNGLMEAGKSHGLLPCGLGARDTLRLEAGMPLYGHEMSEDITPIEANLGFFVKMDKADFIGKQALQEKGAPARRRTGLKVVGRGIAREGALVYLDGKEIGVVTSGTQLPYLGYAGAMAMLRLEAREPGTLVQIDVRGRTVEAEVVKLPFYKRESKG